ncbi:hypothetical protein M9H77_27247 [Catharanthus roseus]|uniref:Uncharacterized protein n=1 Tax=Catharanthus roseus TaxID=4058 RepID=A0ACC0AE41_CATRO|nr:hypothetical protein M9H77_27247 [Catharanthus roseus]
MHKSGVPHRLERVDPLEEGVVPQRVWPNRSTWTLHHALLWDGRLAESQEELETKFDPRAGLVGAPGICNLLTQDGQRYSKSLKLGVEFLVQVSLEGYVFLFCFLMLEPSVNAYLEITNLYVSDEPLNSHHHI